MTLHVHRESAVLSAIRDVDFPPIEPRFVGRENVLRTLGDKFSEPPKDRVKIICLYGPGSIGKTTTAVKYFYQYQYRYDNIFFIDASCEDAIRNAYYRIAQHVEENKYSEKSEIIIKKAKLILDQRPFFLIFDNILDEKILIPYLPRFQGHVLITSRLRKLECDAIELRYFEVEQALELKSKFKSLELPEKEVRGIFKHFGGSPMMLKLVFDFLEDQSLAGKLKEAIKDYESKKAEILEHEIFKKFSAVSGILFQFIREKIPLAWDLLKLCSLLDNQNISLSLLKKTAENIIDFSEVKYEKSLEIISKFCIFKKIGEHSLSFHDWVQESILEKIQSEEEIRQLIRLLGIAFDMLFKDRGDVRGIRSNHQLYLNFIKFFNKFQPYISFLTVEELILLLRSCHTTCSFELRTAKINQAFLKSAKTILDMLAAKKLMPIHADIYEELFAIHKNMQVFYTLIAGLAIDSEIVKESKEAVTYWYRVYKAKSDRSERTMRNLLVCSSNYAFSLIKSKTTSGYSEAIQHLSLLLKIIPTELQNVLAHQRGQIYSAIGQLFYYRKSYTEASNAFNDAYQIFNNKDFFPDGHEHLYYVNKWYYLVQPFRIKQGFSSVFSHQPLSIVEVKDSPFWVALTS